VHDLIPLLEKQSFLKGNSLFRRHYESKLQEIKSADAWVANSEHTREQAVKLLKLPAELVEVIHCGISSDHSRKKCLPESSDISEPFLLYVGGADPHKNLPRLIEAFSLARDKLESNLRLVLAGHIPDGERVALQEIVAKRGLPKSSVFFAGYVSDEELNSLYSRCELFVLPSLQEGFGIPLLEANAAGATSVASNRGSIPEILDTPEALFDPLSPIDMAERIVCIISNPSLRNSIQKRQSRSASRFNWSESAQKALVFFRHISEQKRSRLPQYKSGGKSSGKSLSKDAFEVAHQLLLPRSIVDGLGRLDLNRLAGCISVNHPAPYVKRLLVDLSEIVQKDSKSGIQRVLRKRLEYLSGQLPQHGYEIQGIYANSTELGYKECIISTNTSGNLEFDRTQHPLEPRRGDLFFALDYNSLIQSAQIVFYNHLKILGIPRVFLVHDLLPYSNPEWFTHEAEAYRKHWEEYLGMLSKADMIFCVSNNTRSQLRNWLELYAAVDRPDLVVVQNGSSLPDSAQGQSLTIQERQFCDALPKGSIFLMVGTLEPRKGYSIVLDAFTELWENVEDSMLQLLIVGKEGWSVSELVDRLGRHPELGRRLHWLRGVSDAFLCEIYKSSSCLIAASYGEGFGLPLAEAASHGLPVIARDIPVFREVGGNWPTYFNSDDPKQIAAVISKWCLENPPRAPRLPPPALPTWDETGEKMLAALIELHNRFANRRTESFSQ
jgi:glycosyltransferase involved in cell wall biosynthesis